MLPGDGELGELYNDGGVFLLDILTKHKPYIFWTALRINNQKCYREIPRTSLGELRAS